MSFNLAFCLETQAPCGSTSRLFLSISQWLTKNKGLAWLQTDLASEHLRERVYYIVLPAQKRVSTKWLLNKELNEWIKNTSLHCFPQYKHLRHFYCINWWLKKQGTLFTPQNHPKPFNSLGDMHCALWVYISGLPIMQKYLTFKTVSEHWLLEVKGTHSAPF